MTDISELKSIIADLKGLFVEENENIKQGRYQDLKASGVEKSKKITTLERALFRLKSEEVKEAVLPDMQSLQKQASINATLLSSAINGVKSANSRLSSILDRERNTGTYDRRGRSVQIAETNPIQLKML